MPIGNDPSVRHHDRPVYWFVTLELALDRGDFRRADQAVAELKRLGVVVRYRRPRKGRRHAR